MKNIEKDVCDFFKIHIVGLELIDEKTIVNFPDMLVDDGELILEAFNAEFNIINCDLNFDKYFNPVKSPFFILYDFFKSTKRLQKIPEITVGHMINVAKRKKWFDPIARI
jgi:hypothetical protein